MRDAIEKLIVEWLKSGNENATYLAHQICTLLGVSVRYFKCSKCGAKIQTTNDEDGRDILCQQPISYRIGGICDGRDILCQEPMSFRTSGICAGTYDIEISKREFNN